LKKKERRRKDSLKRPSLWEVTGCTWEKGRRSSSHQNLPGDTLVPGGRRHRLGVKAKPERVKWNLPEYQLWKREAQNFDTLGWTLCRLEEREWGQGSKLMLGTVNDFDRKLWGHSSNRRGGAGG